jgi:hypothetical protein
MAFVENVVMNLPYLFPVLCSGSLLLLLVYCELYHWYQISAKLYLTTMIPFIEVSWWLWIWLWLVPVFGNQSWLRYVWPTLISFLGSRLCSGYCCLTSLCHLITSLRNRNHFLGTECMRGHHSKCKIRHSILPLKKSQKHPIQSVGQTPTRPSF